MKHEDFDIPEVFRRAMEEAGWRTERDDDGGKRPPRRNVTPSSRPRRINRTLVIIFLVLLFVFSLGSIASFYTDFLWFGTLGYRDMFTRRLVVRAITFVVAFTVAAAVLLGLPDVPAWRGQSENIAGICTAGVGIMGLSR